MHMDITIFLVALATILMCVWMAGRFWPLPTNLPNPVLGALPERVLQFWFLRLTVWMLTCVPLCGRRSVVVKGGGAHVLKTLSNVDLSDRPQSSYRLGIISFSYKEILLQSYSDKWSKLKSLLIHNLLKPTPEELWLDLINDLNRDLHSYRGTTCHPAEMINDSITQIIYALILNKKVDKSSEKFTLMKELQSVAYDVMSIENTSALCLDMCPLLRHSGNQAYRRLLRYRRLARLLMEVWRQETVVGGGGLLHGMTGRNHNQEQQKDKEREDDAAFVTTLELFGVGVANCGGVLATFFNLMAHHPRIQEKLQAEMKRVVPRREMVRLRHMKTMPYMNASLLELLRYHSPTPIVPRVATRNTGIPASDGLSSHYLPKGTSVLVNLWDYHHDPALWPEPFSFIPERFLPHVTGLSLSPENDEQGYGRKRHSQGHRVEAHSSQCLGSFGRGLRKCPGETVAKNCMSLVIANVLKEFTVLPATTLEDQVGVDPKKDFVFRTVLTPVPYKVRFVKKDSL